VSERLGLTAEAFGFLACAGVRPVLERYFAECRAHLAEGLWSLGVCPFCGAPPGFTDIVENGGRRLACHFCGGAWMFERLRCPFCGTVEAKHCVKFQAEGSEEGYLISACKACKAYVKEVDRRLRWNCGSALVEDWGSPHLDVLAHRAGYWRAVPTVVELERAARG
jgi:FdhE protein